MLALRACVSECECAWMCVRQTLAAGSVLARGRGGESRALGARRCAVLALCVCMGVCVYGYGYMCVLVVG